MKLRIIYLSVFIAVWGISGLTSISAQDRVPVREYTNPDEVVTFDRSTSFSRAIDVINQFAQDYAGKIIIDRSATDGTVGITIPPMHWREALDLILQAKYLQLVERSDYFEIVPAQDPRVQQASDRKVTTLPDTALTTDSKEVRINAIFFEGNRRALQEIGVDWSTLTENVPGNLSQFVNQQQQGGAGGGGGGGGAGGQGQQGQLPDVENFEGPFVSVNSKAAQSVSQNVFNSVVNFNDVFGSGISVQALFSAFEADNLGEILASPSVKVLEGQEGHIQVGQDFSIKQRDFAGNVTDQFFSVGTILNVTPRVIERSDTTFIHLDIDAERSSAQPDPVSTIINKQESTTQALLLNNEATVIAGLYRTEASEVRRGIPILKDLPPWFFGLRYIFGYNSKDYQTRELVILIQASIEPGIPERLGKERPGKFEVLEEERQRMQNEIERYRQTGEDDVTPVRGEIDTLDTDDEEVSENFENSGSAHNRAYASTTAKEENAQAEKLKEKVEALEQELQRMRNEQKEYRQSTGDKPAPPVNKEPRAQENEQTDKETISDATGYNDSPKSDKSKEVPSDVETSRKKTTKAKETVNYIPVSNRSESYSYYVIGGSFQKKSNAETYYKKLKQKGYEAQLLKKEDSDFYMVAYLGYTKWGDAKRAYEKITDSDNSDAWVYVSE